MAFSAYAVLILLLTISGITNVAQQQQHQRKSVGLGSSLSPSKQPCSWNSPLGAFKFGFYKQDAGFKLGIWLLTFPDITIVWTAHRDDPPVSTNTTLTLTKDGKLILRTEEGHDKVVGAGKSEPASSASMLDSGNFVLYNNRSDIIWSSFDTPTDTILGNQSLYAGNELFSRISETSSSTGLFRLNMQRDGNLVLYPINTIDDYTEAYWASDSQREQRLHLYLNNTGHLALLNDGMDIVMDLYKSPSDNSSIIRRLTIGHNGILRLFSHYPAKGAYNTSVDWNVPDDLCDVKTFCGLNSYCTLYDDQPMCRCLPGTEFVDPSQTSSGCERKFVNERCKGVNISAEYNMTSMEKIKWDDYSYFKAFITKEECKESCLEDCECDVALYNELNGDERSYCMKQKLPLKSAKRDLKNSSSFVAYFKTGKRNITSSNNTNSVKPQDRNRGNKAILLILVITIGLVTCSCVFLTFSGVFIFKYQVLKYEWLLENGSLGLADESNLRSFSYNELKKATNRFKEELGKGSFGAVYKGTLYKGEKLVAVKKLEKMVTEGEREFRAEMHVIGRTHHKNLVRLLGYCAEESKRLLVYEYMSNGSLADFLFRGAERSPCWNKRVRIALDVAKGILYLHDECEASIIHCDIKPQNILMDEFWTAKISDFGLAKLLMPDQTRTFTLVRGTRGYMAPEWYKNTPISVKADVYSYGVVLLEIVCCRRNMEIDPSKPEEIVLINWAYKCFIDRELNKLVRGQEVDRKTLENMIKIGLWCVQDEPALRPSMKSVVQMLEGITDISEDSGEHDQDGALVCPR